MIGRAANTEFCTSDDLFALFNAIML